MQVIVCIWIQLESAVTPEQVVKLLLVFALCYEIDAGGLAECQECCCARHYATKIDCSSACLVKGPLARHFLPLQLLVPFLAWEVVSTEAPGNQYKSSSKIKKVILIRVFSLHSFSFVQSFPPKFYRPTLQRCNTYIIAKKRVDPKRRVLYQTNNFRALQSLNRGGPRHPEKLKKIREQWRRVRTIWPDF